MRKTKKQLMKSGIAGLLIASMAVGGGTLAYLTDAETAENTFTVGKVKISLLEPNYPGNESEQVKELVPNEIVKKDPQVKNVGINDAIIYLKVEVPKADVTVAGDGGARGDKKVQEIFTLKNLKTGNEGTWMEIRKDDSATDKCVYIFAYKTKLAKDATTTPLFDEVQLKNVLEKEIDATTQDIKINAYAIQADNILDIDTTTLDQTTLSKVYDIYVNQSDEKGTALLDAQFLNVRMKTLAGDSSPTYDSENKTITAIQHSDTEPTEEVKANADSLVSTDASKEPVYMWFEDGVIKWWSNADRIFSDESLAALCYGMSALTDISGLADLDTSKVIYMRDAFRGCESLSDLSPLSAWDTSNAIDMGGIFAGNGKLTDLSPLTNWHTSNAENMDGVFRECSSLSALAPLTNWDISNVKNINRMFGGCSGLTDVSALSDWRTGNIENMNFMFDGCRDLVNLTPLSNWNTSNVKTMYGMFNNCSSLTTLTGLENWNTGKATDIGYMFGECAKLSDVSAINDWDIANVTIFYEMFKNAPSHLEFTK